MNVFTWLNEQGVRSDAGFQSAASLDDRNQRLGLLMEQALRVLLKLLEQPRVENLMKEEFRSLSTSKEVILSLEVNI